MARYCFTDATDGDFSIDAPAPDLARRRAAVVDLPWSWLRQVHGAVVHTVTEPGEYAGSDGDALVTAVPGAALAVQTADCGPVVLLADGVVGLAHAGWRGVASGVIANTVDAMAALGAGEIRAVVGPCIRARCYEFGAADLDEVAAALGDGVRSRTGWGTDALDLTAAIHTALAAAGVADVRDAGTCTACSPVHYSYRARGEAARHAAVVWLQP